MFGPLELRTRGRGAADGLAQGTPFEFDADGFQRDAASFTEPFAVTAVCPKTVT